MSPAEEVIDAGQTLRELRVPVICEVLYANASTDISRYAATVQGITEYLKQVEYGIFRIQKKPSGQFHGLEPITAFPIKVWTAENADQCDYLLIPKEKRATYHILMASGPEPAGGAADRRGAAVRTLAIAYHRALGCIAASSGWPRLGSPSARLNGGAFSQL